MDTLDPAGEFLRITERYRQMSDDELLVLIPQSSELTPFAQQALTNEVRQRGLKAEAEVKDEGPSAPSPFKASQSKPTPALLEHESPKFRDSAGDDLPEADSSDDHDLYEEDRKLVELCTVWSVRDALQVRGGAKCLRGRRCRPSFRRRGTRHFTHTKQRGVGGNGCHSRWR